jgi:SAM-dependent methyltransferase
VGGVFIDVGCGERKHPGSFGIDIAALANVDLVADVTRGLPFRDDSVDGVYASHVLEHFDDLVGVMCEIWRVCKPGSRVYITVPHASSSFMTWRDPTHKRGVTLSTFSYFDRRSFEGQLFNYYGGVDFRTIYTRLRFVAGGKAGRYASGRRIVSAVITDMLESIANRSRYAQHLCERWWSNWIGVAEAYAVLEVVKAPADTSDSSHTVKPGRPVLPLG